jgi:hypothetical protein
LKNYDMSGNLIAYRRSKFNMFKSVEIELNDVVNKHTRLSSLEKESCLTDDVGLICFLQPFDQGTFSSAVCVACSLITDDLNDSYIRGLLSQHLAECIEKANEIYQLPVLLAVALGDEPVSRAYQMLRTGRIPITATPPRTISDPPRCSPVSRTSVR